MNRDAGWEVERRAGTYNESVCQPPFVRTPRSTWGWASVRRGLMDFMRCRPCTRRWKSMIW